MPTKTKKTEYRQICNCCLEKCNPTDNGIVLIFLSRSRSKQFRVTLDWYGAAWLVENVIAERIKTSRIDRERIANLNKRFGIE